MFLDSLIVRLCCLALLLWLLFLMSTGCSLAPPPPTLAEDMPWWLWEDPPPAPRTFLGRPHPLYTPTTACQAFTYATTSWTCQTY